MSEKDAVLEALKGIQATLDGVSKRLETVESDQAILMANDEKLNGRINQVASMTGGPTADVSGPQVAALQQKLEALENNPLLTRDPQKIKERHAQALRRAGEREREAGVHSMWHPELNPAKRDGLPLCKVVRTLADKEEAQGQGYLDSLEQAAQALLTNDAKRAKEEAEAFEHARANGLPATAPAPVRFKTVKQALAALHTAEQRLARGQVAAQPAPVMVQPQAQVSAA